MRKLEEGENFKENKRRKREEVPSAKIVPNNILILMPSFKNSRFYVSICREFIKLSMSISFVPSRSTSNNKNDQPLMLR